MLEPTTTQAKPKLSPIDLFAKELCGKLAAQGHKEFDSQDVIWGIASFLKVIAEITAKQLPSNFLEQVDN